ncbi:MAG: ABC transporter permease [Lachnospiraceae bacterium]|nr:ABC transporter permease [Lachnospiraceae bacterium]
MTQIWEYIKIAFMNIKSNKGRSILTMLGIIIGISSVIMIISIGNTIKVGINDGLDSIAGGQIYLYSYGENEEGIVLEFTDDDLEALKENVKNIKAITPQWGFNGQVSGRKGTFEGYITAGNSGLQYAKSEPIIKGRYFTDSDYYSGKKVCVLDENSATQLFGNTNVIGMTVEIAIWSQAEEYTIVGIREVSASSMITMMEGSSLNIEIPLKGVASALGIYIDTYSDVLIVSDGAENATQVARDSVRFLENRYNVRGKDAIQIQNFNDIMSEVTSILDYVTIFVVLVAAISLLVGGIGVMNIMLVSVTERTREIGIRKALGARTGSILLQFLSESAIISLMGGVIGILLGVAGAAGVCALIGQSMGGLSLQIEASTILGASLFSTAVGIFFGIYPARKAAKLSPIEALRHE